ncbi:hypothetical protein BC332_13714 [Capsicum chinense]|nr:hypothetical protein BC332_13714 [Capsicum chinense]
MGADSRTNRDKGIYPAPKIDLTNPWQITKKITQEEAVLGMVVVPFFEMFEYILRYWVLYVAKRLVKGNGVCINIWDVTEENDPKKYEAEAESVCFRMLHNDYSLSCTGLFNDHGLGVSDEIGLYWDPRSSSLMFKLLSKDHESFVIEGLSPISS